MRTDGVDVGLDIDFGIAFHVANAEAAAEVQNFCGEAQGLLHFCDKADHDIRRGDIGLDIKDLGTDMAMEAAKLNVHFGQRRFRHLCRKSRFDRGSELGIHAARADLFVGMGINAGSQTKEDLLSDPRLFCVFVNAGKLLHAVDDEITDAVLDGVFDIEVGFVISVEERALHRESRADRSEKLARGNDVRADAFLCHDAVNFLEAEGFGSEKRHRGFSEVSCHCFLIFAYTHAHACVIEKENGRSVFFSE